MITCDVCHVPCVVCRVPGGVRRAPDDAHCRPVWQPVSQVFPAWVRYQRLAVAHDRWHRPAPTDYSVVRVVNYCLQLFQNLLSRHLHASTGNKTGAWFTHPKTHMLELANLRGMENRSVRENLQATPWDTWASGGGGAAGDDPTSRNWKSVECG
jgi:hypothetical protein